MASPERHIAAPAKALLRGWIHKNRNQWFTRTQHNRAQYMPEPAKDGYQCRLA